MPNTSDHQAPTPAAEKILFVEVPLGDATEIFQADDERHAAEIAGMTGESRFRTFRATARSRERGEYSPSEAGWHFSGYGKVYTREQILEEAARQDGALSAAQRDSGAAFRPNTDFALASKVELYRLETPRTQLSVIADAPAGSIFVIDAEGFEQVPAGSSVYSSLGNLVHAGVRAPEPTVVSVRNALHVELEQDFPGAPKIYIGVNDASDAAQVAFREKQEIFRLCRITQTTMCNGEIRNSAPYDYEPAESSSYHMVGHKAVHTKAEILEASERQKKGEPLDLGDAFSKAVRDCQIIWQPNRTSVSQLDKIRAAPDDAVFVPGPWRGFIQIQPGMKVFSPTGFQVFPRLPADKRPARIDTPVA